MNHSSHMIVVPGQVIDFPICFKAVMAAVMANEFPVALDGHIGPRYRSYV